MFITSSLFHSCNAGKSRSGTTNHSRKCTKSYREQSRKPIEFVFFRFLDGFRIWPILKRVKFTPVPAHYEPCHPFDFTYRRSISAAQPNELVRPKRSVPQLCKSYQFSESQSTTTNSLTTPCASNAALLPVAVRGKRRNQQVEFPSRSGHGSSTAKPCWSSSCSSSIKRLPYPGVGTRSGQITVGFRPTIERIMGECWVVLFVCFLVHKFGGMRITVWWFSGLSACYFESQLQFRLCQ